MILHVLRNLGAARSVGRVLVATDDWRVADTVRAAGGEAVMTSADLPSGSDRVWAASADIPADIIVNVQCDEPLLGADVVDALIHRLRSDPESDIATPVVTVSRAKAATDDVVTVAVDSGAALYFSRSVIPWGSEQVLRHVGVYAYRRAALARYVSAAPSALEGVEHLEQLRALSIGLRIAAVEVETVVHAVDRPQDVAVVERILAGRPDGPGPEVRLLVLDVDGVLTDGRISYAGDDSQVVSFDVKDGYGLVALMRAGIHVAIISARDSPALRRRADELGIVHLHAGVIDKVAALTELSQELGIPLSEVCYVGDDSPDVAAMAMAGSSAAPSDASPTAAATATILLGHPGGRGAVRELSDLLLARRMRQPGS